MAQSRFVSRVLRTPEERFANLKGFPYEPKYFTTHLFCESGTSIRMAYIDEGPRDAVETLLLTHGEPSWSYLNRKLIGPLVAKGYRCVAPDLVGFGRSDKPARDEDYTYERHVAWLTDLLCHHLDLHGVTAVFQDWGGLLGLRVVTAQPSRFRRIVLANTLLPGSGDAVPEAFYRWKAAAPKLMTMPIGEFLARGAGGPNGPIDAAEKDGYSAPFPTEEHKAGARRFPELVPTPPEDPTGRPQSAERENNEAAWCVLRAWKKPTLLAFSDGDAVTQGLDKVWMERCPGTQGQQHVTIKGCGHFLQDGGAEQLVDAVCRFIQQNPPSSSSKL